MKPLPRALDVEDGLGVEGHEVGAGHALRARASPRRASATAARRRTGWRGRWRPARAPPGGLVAAQAAQALDRRGERELRAAEPLDEVAAPRRAERLEVRELGVERREAALDPLGQGLLAGDDAVALEHDLRQRADPLAVGGRAGEQRRGQRPAALDLRRGRAAAAGEAAAPRARRARRARATAAARAAAPRRRSSPRRPRRGPRARPAARPARPPHRRPRRRRPAGRSRTTRRARGGRGSPRGRAPPAASPLMVGRADEGRVLAEVEGDPPRRAAERARADPDDLAARAERVHPGRRVGADAARQHVALPHLGREREPLERHEHLAQAVDARAAGRRRVDALPGGQEARVATSARPARPPCAAPRATRAAAAAAPRGRTTRAPSRPGAARRARGRRRARARAGPARSRRRSGRSARPW